MSQNTTQIGEAEGSERINKFSDFGKLLLDLGSEATDFDRKVSMPAEVEVRVEVEVTEEQGSEK